MHHVFFISTEDGEKYEKTPPWSPRYVEVLRVKSESKKKLIIFLKKLIGLK
jgi:hypothetical protein